MLPIFAGFNILKLFAGFNIFNGEKLGKLIFYAILIAIGIGVYHKTFIAPTQKTVISKPQTVIMNKCEKDFAFVGVQLWRIKLGMGIK